VIRNEVFDPRRSSEAKRVDALIVVTSDISRDAFANEPVDEFEIARV
jgi:hypothetical protein